MTSTVTNTPILKRYSRAVQFTPPKLAVKTAGCAADGYWLDANRYFFIAERIDPVHGLVLESPSIAYGDTESVEELIPLEALAGLISSQSSEPIDFETMCSAEFDMPDTDTLGIS